MELCVVESVKSRITIELTDLIILVPEDDPDNTRASEVPESIKLATPFTLNAADDVAVDDMPTPSPYWFTVNILDDPPAVHVIVPEVAFEL